MMINLTKGSVGMNLPDGVGQGSRAVPRLGRRTGRGSATRLGCHAFTRLWGPLSFGGLALWMLLLLPQIGLLAQSPSAVRIMPLGDSITEGYSFPNYASGYRSHLYNLLTNAGFNVDYVGTQRDTSPAVPDPNLPDHDHEGHGGYEISQIDAGINTWLNSIDYPDVILLLIGVKDFTANDNISTATNRLATLISHIAAQRPYAKIIVGNLLLRTDNPTLEQEQQTLYNPYSASDVRIVKRLLFLLQGRVIGAQQ